jgi:serine protease Do
MMSTEQVPFCQRNIRLWVTLLVGSGAVVLGFAIWLAASDAKQSELGAVLPGQWASEAVGAARPVAAAKPNQASSAALILAGSEGGGGAKLLTAWHGVTRTVGSPALQLQSAFNRSADAIRPSVVNINAIRPSFARRAAAQNALQFVDPFDGVPDKVFGKLAYESVGSGLIVDPVGYIVTNDHLVGQATAIMVTRYNHANEHLPAHLVATDPRSDLALIKLDREGRFTAARFADSNKVEVGDWVLAVGNPFGLGHTVTSGIVSGRRNTLAIAGVEYRGLIQTDAPINQGSSGGPLVNLEGRVIGINTAIYAPTGVFNGTGFAIPSNRVSGFVARALNRQREPRTPVRPIGVGPSALGPPWLGVHVSNVTALLAKKLSMPKASGVFVHSVAPDGPAANAGVRRGDVIIVLAGVPVTSTTTLDHVVVQVPLGQKVSLVVWRKGKPKKLTLKIKAVRGRQ